MIGLDQIVVALWFLPVVVFIIIPLAIGAIWLPVSLFLKFIRREVVLEDYTEKVKVKSSV